jgi:hypothetical protein
MTNFRSERRKWAACFEDVTSVVFLVSLADYNAGIIEDKGACHRKLRHHHHIHSLSIS